MSINWDEFKPADEPADQTPAAPGAVDWSAFQPVDAVPAKASSIGDRVKDIGVTLAKGVMKTPEAVVGLYDIATGGRAGKFAEEHLGYAPKQWQDAIDAKLTPEQRAANAKVQQAEGFVDTVSTALQNPSTILHAGVESLPSMVQGGLLGRGLAAGKGLAPWLAGAVGEGIIGGGSAAESIRQQTKDGELTAGQTGAAIATGIGTTVFGAAGGRFAEKLGITDIDTWLAKAATASGGKIAKTPASVAGRIAAGGISEGLFEELPQSVQETIWQNAALGKPLDEGVGNAAAMGLLTGASMGGLAAIRKRKTAEDHITDIGNADTVSDAIKSADAAVSAPLDTSAGTDITAEDIERMETAAGMPPAAGAPAAAPNAQTPPEVAPSSALYADDAGIYAATAPANANLADIWQSRDFSALDKPAIDRMAPGDRTAAQAAVVEGNTVTGGRVWDLAQRYRAERTAGPEQVSRSVDVPRERDFVTPPTGTFGQVDELASLTREERADAEQRRAAIAANKPVPTNANIFQTVDEADAAVARGREENSAKARNSILDTVIAAETTASMDGKQLQRAYARELAKQGYKDTAPTPAELAKIIRAAGVKDALADADAPLPSTPNELVNAVREKRASQAAADPLARVKNLMGNGYRLTGKQLTGPNGEKQNLSPRELKYAKAPKKDTGLMAAAKDGDWHQFPTGTGTLGIPRAEMPQIKAKHRGAMVNFLNARGITHEEVELTGDELKPTQAEFSIGKVDAARAHGGGERSILISSDGHVLDGHHQWLAKVDAGQPVKAIRLNAPIKDLLETVKDFPSATTDDASEAAAPDAPAKPLSATEQKRQAKIAELQGVSTSKLRKLLKKERSQYMRNAIMDLIAEREAETSLKRQKAGTRTHNRAKDVDPERDGMGAALAKMGGIDRDSAAGRMRLTPEELNFRGWRILPVFTRNGGMSMDEAGAQLAELGYVASDENGKHDQTDFEDKLADVVNGNEVYTAQGYERLAMDEYEAAMQEVGAADVAEFEEIEDYADSIAEAFAPGEAADWLAKYEADLAQDPDVDFSAAGQVEFEAENAPFDGNVLMSDEEIDHVADQIEGIEAGRSPEVRTQAAPRESAEGTGAPGSDGFELAAETPDEVRAKVKAEEDRAKAIAEEKRKLEAARKKEQDDKDIRDRMDASADNFQLGQDAMDSLSGQQDIFSAPAAQPDPDEQDRYGLRQSDRDKRDLDSAVNEFTLQTIGEMEDGITAEEVVRGAKHWAEEAGLDFGKFMRALHREWTQNREGFGLEEFVPALLSPSQYLDGTSDTKPAKLAKGDKVRVKGDDQKLRTIEDIGDDGWVYLKDGAAFPPEKAAELLYHSEAKKDEGSFGSYVRGAADAAPAEDLDSMFDDIMAEEAAAPAGDLDAMFDDILAEESAPAGEQEDAPKTWAEIKAESQWVTLAKGEQRFRWNGMDYGTIIDTHKAEGRTGDRRYRTSDGELHMRLDAAKVHELETQTQPRMQADGYLQKEQTPIEKEKAKLAKQRKTKPAGPTPEAFIKKYAKDAASIKNADVHRILLEARDQAGEVAAIIGEQGHLLNDVGKAMESLGWKYSRMDGLRPIFTKPGSEPRTTGQAAGSAIKNAASGALNAIDALGALFGGKGTLGSGPVFNEETYAKAKPLFSQAIADFKQAGSDIKEVMRAVIRAVLDKFGPDVTANMKPYVVRFVQDYQDGTLENNDATDAGNDTEQDSQGDDGQSHTEENLFDAGPAKGGRTRKTRGGASGSRSGKGRGTGVSGRNAADDRTQGDSDVSGNRSGSGNSDSGNTGGSGQPGSAGSNADTRADGNAAGNAGTRLSIEEKIRLQRQAESIPVEPADLDNIRETLPLLMEGQQDDVLFAEKRFANPDKQPGVMFTNGTGTGKTFTGLGIAKRMVRQGKTEGIIVVPNNEIADDWIAAGEKLGLTIRKLDSTSENGGKGITITTFANFGENATLADRRFDWTMADEAHYLMASKDGKATNALATLRALTRHPDGFHAYSRMINRDLFAKIDAAKESGRDAKPLWAELQKREDRQRPEYAAVAKSNLARPKAIFLSATPFAYVKAIDYAEGYLFAFDREETGSGYNSGDGRERFYMQHFGYRMRYNKLTRPDGKVNEGLMARQFNSWLKAEGALSGRMLDVEADYDRKFVMVDSALGKKIDEGMEYMREAADGYFKPLFEPFMKQFDYLRRRFLLEAIKATEAVPIAREHLAKGRKVVIIHDYKKGGAFNPFTMEGINGTVYTWNGNEQKEIDLGALAAEFKRHRPDLVKLQFPRDSALDILTTAFPNALVHNGSVPKKQLALNKTLFNAENDNHPVLILQSDKGREGISLHDTTGKYQRVEINIGLPAKPTSLIQLEGRIYRVGQVTDAVFRYLNTGTNWERWTFAETIAERADTAEALAMGDLARGLKDSIVEAFEDSADHPITDEDGKGGKARDRANAKIISEWDRAKSFYYGQAKKNASTKAKEGKDYFATPEPLGMKMVEWADIRPGEDVLEPSVGHGAIARWFPIQANKTVVDNSNVLLTRAKLVMDGNTRFVDSTFERFDIVNKYDAIVMNPPFGIGGSDAIPHLAKAYRHLRDGGRIVALLPRGPAADGKLEKFLYGENAPKDLHMVADINLPASTFERAGTGVMTHVVVLEKISDLDKAPSRQYQGDMTSAEDINAFFDRLEHVTIPGRVKTDQPVEIAIEEAKPTKAPKKKRQAAEGATGVERFYSTFQFNHSKSGEPMFGAAVINTLSATAYKDVNALAKQNGGWYSKFVGGGAQRGFLFKSAESRQAFMDAAGTGVPEVRAGIMESRGQLRGGMHAAQVESAIAPLLAKFKGFRNVTVVQSITDLPARYANDFGTSRTEGFYDPRSDEVFLIADHIGSAERAVWVTAHEVIGHGGLRMLEDKSLTEALSLAYSSKFVQELAQAIARDRGETIDQSHPEEALAEMAAAIETGNFRALEQRYGVTVPDTAKNGIRGAIARVLAKLKAFLASIAGTKPEAFTDADVRQLVQAARRAVEGRTGISAAFEVANGGVRASKSYQMTRTPAFRQWFGASAVVNDDGSPMVVYHGSADDIDAFEDGKGIKNDAGWLGRGFYFTTNPQTAGSYANTKAGKEWPNVMPVYLSIKNPYRATQRDKEKGMFADRRGDKDAPFKRREELIAQGYDGVVLDYRSGGWAQEQEFVAFYPEQIKSAIGNNGNFDPYSPRIHESRRPIPAAAWEMPDGDWKEDLIYKLQNKQIDLKRAVTAVREAIGDITDKWNAYLKEELFHGRVAKRTKDFLETELRPLLDEMRARGVTMPEFEQYLHMRHVEERNIQIAKVNPEMPDGGSGVDTADAQDYLANLPPAKKQAYEALARRIDAITKGNRELLVSSGLETRATMDAWEGAYKYYVPLMREDVDQVGNGTGQGYSVRGSASKRAMGSDKAVVDILANIVMQRERTIVRAEKNRISMAMYGLALQAPNPDVWRPINPAKSEKKVVQELEAMGLTEDEAENLMSGPRERYIDKKTGLVAFKPKSIHNDPHVLAFRVNGEDRYIVFNKSDDRAKRMAEALKNVDMHDMGELLSKAAVVTRWFAQVNTQFNPVFGVVNGVRDAGSVVLNLTSTPLAGKQAEVIKNGLSALIGIYSDVRAHRKGVTSSSAWGRLYEEYQLVGGQTGYRDMFSNAQERARAIMAELDPDHWTESKWGKVFTAGGMLKVPMTTAVKLAKPLFDWLSDFNETVENAFRLATYKAAVDMGLSRDQAASIAKNISVNFNRKGQAATQVGAMYAFFNASIQGTARMKETLMEKDGFSLSKAGKTIVYGGMLLGVLQALALAAAGFDDDEPPQFVRERNLILPDFITGSGKYLAWPMPLGYHILPNIGRIATEYAMSGFKKPGDRIAHLLGMLFETFNPIGSAGWSMQTLAPTFLDPLVAIAENKDWTGKAIAKEDFNSNDPTPGYTRAKDTASAIGKAVAYGVNRLSFGTDYQPGFLSPTPDQIDYLLGQVFGGVGRETLKLQQTISAGITGEELPAYKVPLLGRLYGDTTGQASIASQFYNNLRDLNGHERELKGRKEDGGDVAGYRKANPEARFVDDANKVEREVRELRKQKREAIDKGASQERVKLLDQRISNKMRQFNEKVEAARQ